MTTTEIKVGSGSVALVDVMGSPLSVVNAARVSMGKRADEDGRSEIGRSSSTCGIITTPHPFAMFSFSSTSRLPSLCCANGMKHQVGCSWNEISGRYVELGQDYWKPRAWREASESVKQGSGGELPREVQLGVHHIYADAINTVATAYELLLSDGCVQRAGSRHPAGERDQ
jgi:thymidylate synthase (FAD)